MGQPNLLTAVVLDRKPVFSDFHVGCAAARILGNGPISSGSRCLAWVLMPDHMHLLVELGEESVSGLMQRVKGRISFAVGHVRPCGRLWQAGFHDHALRTDEALVDAARYLVANPLRAGLVERIGDYPSGIQSGWTRRCWGGNKEPAWGRVLF